MSSYLDGLVYNCFNTSITLFRRWREMLTEAPSFMRIYPPSLFIKLFI